MRERRLQTLFSVLVLCAALIAVPAHSGEVAKANLDILGLGLEVSRDHITTPVGVPATVQTMFGGETNERAPAAPGMNALAELTGPGIVTPITLAATPGHKFSLPPLHEKGDYELTNIRLAGANGEFLQQAVPSFASITVDDILKTEVKVRQLTPEELRERGITVDLRNYDVYEYTVIFGVEDEFVEVPYPVIVDKRTHEIQKLVRENSYRLPELSQKRPPRYNPPGIEEFEFSPGGGGPPGSDPEPPGAAGPRIPAAIILPNGFGVLHQFFAVIVQVSNTSPDSKIRLDNIAATISMPPAMRTSKVVPETSLGQPVQIYDANTKTTFLVAGARGTAEWTLEALKAGTHNIDVTVEADYQQEGQPAFRMRGRASTAIVVNDPRFQITFSHPDNVRVDEPYTAYAFITNLSAQRQHIRLEQDQTIPHCDTGAKVNNICRTEGENIVELDLEPGEMKTVDYKLMSRITGHVFAGAGAANDEALSVAVKLHMGVSQSGIPLSPATLVMPYYARFLPGDFISANMQLLGLGYSVATAPLTKHTSRFPRVIKSDVFQRAQEIARAGQRIFATRKFLNTDNPEENRDAYFHLALDHLGNVERTDHATIAPDLFEWDELRRREVSGRRAAEAMGKQLVKHGLHNGRTHQQFVTDFAQAASHRNPYLFAYVHGADVTGQVRPYALELTGIDTQNEVDVPAVDKGTGFVRTMPYAELMTFDANGEKGELALLGRWSESIRVRVIPRSSSFTLHLIYPDTATGQHLRSDISITGATPGLEVKVDVARGSRTLVVSGGTATPVVDSVEPPALRVLGAAQDLHLNKAGHQVSVLFNRPVKVADVLKLRDQFALTINVADANYSVTRRNDPTAQKPVQIPAAALQSDGRFVNVTFDKPLSVNAKYILGLESFRDLVLPAAPLYSANDIVPRIDNNAPGAILTGRVLSGENAPIAGAEVMLSAWGPIQYDFSESDGRFLFEYVPRDIANSISGNYKLEARAGGRATMVEGAVRLVGQVHTVNLVFLGRGRANGYVKYSDGEVLKDTKVTIGSTLFGHFREGRTNDQGYYEIGDLPVGPLTFSAVDPDGRPTFAANALRFAGEVITQDLILEKTPFPGTGTVRVTVRRADTDAVVEGARVGVYTQGYALTEGASDPNGYIEFRKVPAGLISIITAHFGISRETPGIELEMKADQIIERTIYIGVPPATNPGYAALEGVVFRDDPTAPGDRTKDVPVPGAIITIANLPAVTADANGAYTYPDLPTALSGKSNAMLVFDPVTGRKAWYPLPALFGGQTARFSPILKSAEPEGEATIRVRLTSATGEPVTDYRVIEPGFPPDVYTHIGGGVYERSGIRVPMKVAVVAVPKNPTGPYGEQMAGGKGRVDFAGQIGIINVRLPGQGNIITALKLRQVQSACPTDQPCYTDAFGKVAISYSVWDEIEQSTKAKTVVKEADADQLNRFTKVPALQPTGIYTDRHPAGFDSEVRTLAYEGDTQSVTLIMETVGEVTGRVFSYDRQTPVGGAVVTLSNGKVIYGTQATKPDGSFRFAGIQDGLTFRVLAEYTRDGILRKGYADGTTAKSSGGAQNVIVVMREQSNIEGQVVDAAGNPVPLARYAFSELAWPNTKYGTDQEPLQTDINGKFYLTNIFTGPFRITAADPIVQEQRGHYQGELRFEGDTSQLTIKVVIGNNGLGTIIARVVDSTTGNAPVQNAEVRLYRGNSSFDLASTDEHGVVRFDRLPAGSNYSLSAYSKSAGRAGSSGSFALAKDGEVSVEIVLSFLGRVAGYVTDPETVPANLPSKGDPVQVNSPGVSQRTSTDSEGKFEVKGVPEGPFKLFVYDLESGRMGFGPDNLFISKTVQEHTNLHLELEKTATLTVNAYLPTDNGQQGELAPLVDVLVETTDYYREAQGQSLKFERMITRYGYKITARELGGEHRKIEAHGSWPAGVYAKTHNVTFPSTGSIIIRVKDNLGNPVPDAKVSANGATMYTPTNGTLELKNIPFGWITVYASKGPLGASEGKDLRSRSIPLEFNLNLGQTVDVVGTVIAEEGVNLPSPSTRIVMTIDSHLIANGTRRLETFTGPDGKFRFTGVPVGNTKLHLIYYGPDDTTIGWESIPDIVIPDTQTTDFVIAPKKLDATPPRVLKIVPAANENNVSPTANVIITFSEQVAAKHLTTQFLQLRANDSSAVIPVEILPFVNPSNNTFEVTLKPVHPQGQKYPLKSNMLYRLSVVQGMQDTTGNAMLSTVGSSFTTVDYSEPAVVRVTPDPKDALSSATFYVKFNKQVDINSLKPEYGGIFKIEQIDKPGGAVVQTLTLAPPYIDTADPTVIVAAVSGSAIAESSFYRLTVDKVRDLQVPPNIQKDIKVVEYFSFDETAPVARILSPVAEGEKLVSGVLYRATVEVTDDGTTTEADDVDVVYWLDSDGKYLTERRGKPWAYEFEAPATDVERTYTLQVSARDLSGNPSPSATPFTWTVIPNAPPSNVTLTVNPASAYPTQTLASTVTFNDEGVKVTVSIRLVGQKTNGEAVTVELGSKQLTRAKATDPWPAATFTSTLPLDLKPGTAQIIAKVAEAKFTEVTENFEILADTSNPEVVSSLPKAETRYAHEDPYTIELKVRDAQTGINANSVTMSIAGTAVPVASITKTVDNATGIHTFRYSTTAGARNADTRIPIVVTVADGKGNVLTHTTEVIFERVDDTKIPVAAWVTPLDGAPMPFGDLMNAWEATLRIYATDDEAVVRVRFESDRFLNPVTPLTTANAGTNYYQAKVKFKPWTAQDPMRPFVITAFVEDVVASHTVELPITIEPVLVDVLVQSVGAISSVTVGEYMDKNVVIRGTGYEFPINVPVRMKNLLVLDGANVNAFEETKLDLTITERFFVDADSRLDVYDRGYLGGNRTGKLATNKNTTETGRTIGGTTTGGATSSSTAGDASHAGIGGEEDDNNTNATYGSITDPLDFGAGGSSTSAGSPGGNGGGVLHIRGAAAGTAKLIIAGTLRADGGTGESRSGAGAGGSINLEGQTLITGPKTRITVNGGSDNANAANSQGGGAGRIAIRVTQRLDIADRKVVLQANGGLNGTNDAANYVDGGAGTIFIHAPGATKGELIVSGYDEEVPTSTGKLRGTPLSGTLDFDAITIGPRAVVRFDNAYTAGTFTVDPTALVLTPTDVPTVTINSTVPAAGGDVTQGTDVKVTFVASSPAGVTRTKTTLAVQPTPQYNSYANPPLTTPAATETLPAPSASPVGPTTLKVLVTDRAGRTAESTVPFNIVANQAPQITVFTVTPPDQLYAGGRIDASITATDDIAVSNITLASTHGTPVSGGGSWPGTAATPRTRTYQWTIPQTLASGTKITLTATATDQFPASSTRTHELLVRKDEGLPAATVVKPQANQVIQEVANGTFDLEVTATDAEVGVKTVTATFEGQTHTLTFVSGTTWRKTGVALPDVDGTANVEKSVTFNIADYEGNIRTASVTFFIKPLNDPSAPELSWLCSSQNAMYPAGLTVPLRVTAMPRVDPETGITNGTSKVELSINGGANVLATRIAGTENWTYDYAIPGDAVAGSVITLRATATSTSNKTSQITGSITIVTGVTISTKSFINADDTTYNANTTVIVANGGELVITGPRTLKNLILLSGGKLVQQHLDIGKADLLTVERLFVACNAEINVNGLGYAKNTTYPGAALADDASGGSHIGRGGLWSRRRGGVFGSVYRPMEGGGGGVLVNASSAGNGGGSVRIHATASAAIDGAIKAKGASATYGTSAGGSIWITTNALSGGGTADASGGDHVSGSGATGGGGAISLEYATVSGKLLENLTAKGGANDRVGGAGSIYLKSATSTYGDLRIDNTGRATTYAATELPSFGRIRAASVNGDTVTLSGQRWLSPALAGHWVRVYAADGTERGTWRIESVTNPSSAVVFNGFHEVLTQDTFAYSGYVLYSALGVGGRKVVAVRYANGRWEYDTDATFTPFNPQAGDVILASFTKDTTAITDVSTFDCTNACAPVQGIPVVELAMGELDPNTHAHRDTSNGNMWWSSFGNPAELYLRSDFQYRGIVLSDGTNATVKLTGAANLQSGDVLRGIYRFDTMDVKNARVFTEDLLDVTPVLDATSTITKGNAAIPVVSPAAITIASGLHGPVLTGAANAATDGDAPVVVTARNTNRALDTRPIVWDAPIFQIGNRGGASIHRSPSGHAGAYGGHALHPITTSGFVQFMASQTNQVMVAGLAPADTTNAYTEPGMNAFKLLATGTYEIWSNGVNANKNGSYSTSTIFRIVRTPAAIQWFVNNVQVHERTGTLPARLLFDVSFEQNMSGELHSIVFEPNNSDNGTYSAAATGTGTFTIPVFGQPGDPIAISAQDGHAYTYRSTPVVVATMPANLGVQSVTFASNELTGGRTGTGTVTLASPAGADGAHVTLASSSTLVTIPASVTFLPGATTANFSMSTQPTAANVDVVITATWGGIATPGTFKLMRDTTPPSITITLPAAGTQYTEGTSNGIAIEATIVDADTGVVSATASIDGVSATLTKNTAKGPNVYTGTLSVPYIDGTANVPKDVIVAALDNNANTGTASVQVIVKPVIDENPPVLTWACFTSGGMFGVGDQVRLKVKATPPPAVPANSVNNVTFHITDPSGVTTPYTATALAASEYEYLFTVPSVADGASFEVRAVATTAGGATAQLTRSFVAVTGGMKIAASTTIAANNTSYENQTVIVTGGTTTIVGPHTFKRLIVYPGASVTQQNDTVVGLDLQVTDGISVACTGSIDVSNRGYLGDSTHPDAINGGAYVGGSHIGIGGPHGSSALDGVYGSVYRPREAGAGGYRSTRGGGILRLSTSKLINDGAIRSNGDGADYEGTAGGSIWILTGSLDGSGTIEARGGENDRSGGGGAIAVEYDTASATALANIDAYGGVRNAGAGAGSVYLKQRNVTQYGTLRIDNNTRPSMTTELPSLGKGVAQGTSAGALLATGRSPRVPAFFAGHYVRITSPAGVVKGTWRILSVDGSNVTLEPNGTETIDVQPGDEWQGVYRFDTVHLRRAVLVSKDPIETTEQTIDAGDLTLSSINTGNLTIKSGAKITHPEGGRLEINATGNVTIEADVLIDLDTKGYAGNTTYPNERNVGQYTAGSHIGTGGLHDPPTSASYGSIYRPIEHGAGGYRDGRGGGVLRMTAQSLTMNGTIRVNGQSGVYEGGAGGSVWITTSALAGTGLIEARGGNGDRSGGGGAIAIEYGTATGTVLARLNAMGGTQTRPGGAGSIYTKSGTSTYGSLKVDNGTIASAQPSELPSFGKGLAATGTAGAKLVTNRTENVRPYFVGHWVRIRNASGAIRGTWRVAKIEGKSVTLEPNGNEIIDLQVGDEYQGVYRFDAVVQRHTELRSLDPIETTTQELIGQLRNTVINGHDVTIRAGTVLDHAPDSSLQITATGELKIEAGASIDVSSRGYANNKTYPNLPGMGNYTGGSHMGYGGLHDAPLAATFGSVYMPREAGGGGYRDGRGGGILRITANSIVNDGAIRANGQGGVYEGGAGGSIWITTGTFTGAGVVEANGGGGDRSGGGGAIALEYSAATANTLDNIRATTTNQSTKGGAGTVYLKSATATYGRLVIDAKSIVGQATGLPALGTGLAQTGSGGNVIVTNLTANIQPYFVGHWIEVTNGSGTQYGRIESIDGKTMTLDPEVGPTMNVQPGDRWQGVYRFDSAMFRTSTVSTSDPIRVPAGGADYGSTVIDVNDGAPQFPVAKRSTILVESTAAADAVVGGEGAVTDVNAPIKLMATNLRTGVTTAVVNAAANGSFRIPVTGSPGDTFTLIATDSHASPLTSDIAVNGAIAAHVTPAIELSPESIVAGETATAVVRVSPTPQKTAEVALTRSNSSVTIPASVTFAAGESAKQVSVVTAANANGAVTITATHGTSASATLNVIPSVSATLNSIVLSATSLEGGASINGTVYLGAPAPAGGAEVLLTSSSDRVVVPPSVTVAAGSGQASFTVVTLKVGAITEAFITGTYGETKPAPKITLNPCTTMDAVTPPSNTTLGTVWVDDAAPSGAIVNGTGATFDDTRVATGTAALHFTTPPPATPELRTYSFVGAATKLTVTPSDSLVFYMLVNPCTPPKQVVVSWQHDSASYYASWGESRIDVTVPKSHRGAMPAGGQWVRMEVPFNVLAPTAATTEFHALSVEVHGGEAWLDRFGVTSCTAPTAPAPAFDDNEVVWFDDALPAGAVADVPTSTRNAWSWSNVQVASGTVSHVEGPQAGLHEHTFLNATQGLLLRAGDMLFTYVYLDPCNPPKQLVLAFNDGSWEHRAYWGENLIQGAGTDGAPSRFRMGPLPELGKWVRLEVPVSLVGLDDRTITGAAYALYDGRAWFDRAGKYSRVNVAQGKKIAQNSLYVDGYPERANDGNLGTINHNNGGAQGYLDLDLGAVQPIEHVQIWNRSDQTHRLGAHYIMVSDTPFSTLGANISQSDGASKFHWVGGTANMTSYMVAINRTGRYLRLQMAGSDFLHVREIQAWAPAATKRVNVAGGAVTTSSTPVDTMTQSATAVDGHFNSVHSTTGPSVFRSTSATQAWWQVDLGRVATISAIDIFNRIGAVATDLTDFYVFVSDVAFTGTTTTELLAQPNVSATYHGTSPITMHSLYVNRTGRFVRIQKRNAGELSFAEVQIWSQLKALGALARPVEEK